MRNKMRIKPGIALKRGSGNISRIEPNFTAFARVTFASDTGHCQDEGFFANSGLALWPNIQQKTFAVAIPQRRAVAEKGRWHDKASDRFRLIDDQRFELNELHVDQIGTRMEPHCV